MDLYQEVILDHYKNPQNVGKLGGDKKTLSSNRANVGCGDVITVELLLGEDMKTIQDIKWQGQGCVISISAMSLLSEYIKGKNIEEINQLKDSDMLDLLGLDEISPGREKCLLLSLRAVKEALT